MKILVVCQHYYPENFSITSICEELANRGHDVFVVTGQPNYGYWKIMDGYENVTDEVINNVRIHRVKLYPRKGSRLSVIRNYLSFWHNSKKYIAKMKEEFDVVYSMSLSPVIMTVGANNYAKKHHVRHILHCLDLWPESVLITKAMSKKEPAYRFLYHWSKSIYSKTSKVLVSSPSFEGYFRHVLKLKDLPISYVPQPPLIANQEGEDIEYSHRYNFVYIGNIGTIQMVENVVKAVSIARNHVDIGLHIVGGGVRAEALKELIKNERLEDNVFYYGTMKRGAASAYFGNATAIVVTLKNEGTVGKTIPGKLNTSMMYGKPIFACIGGDGRKVLNESGGTVFAKDETPESMAKAMLELCSMSEGKLREFGKKNADYYHQHFDLAKIADQVEAELEAK